MATPCHWILTLSLFLVTIWCQSAESYAEESDNSTYRHRYQSMQQQDPFYIIGKPLKIQPSRSWHLRLVSDSTKTNPELAEVETTDRGAEGKQEGNNGAEIFAKDFNIYSFKSRRGSFAWKISIQLRLMEKILFSNIQPKRRHRARRNALTTSPPEVNAALGNLNASYCSLFYYRIPEYVFVDKEDGSTRNLSLSLHFEDGTLVDPTSWMQLDVNLQTLYGYLKVSDNALSNSNKSFNYKLRATDSSGLTAETSFSITIPSNPPEVYFRMDLVVNPHENLGTPDVNEVLFLSYRVFSFFQDISFSTLNVISFQKNNSKGSNADSIAFGWTNCTISGKDCPVQLVDSLIGKAIMPDGSPNPSFSDSLQPQYKISELKARKVGTCQTLTTSLLPTATPVGSLSPVIKSVIPELSVSTTVYFSYQIPEETFFDSIDGNTRSLKLQLRIANNISLTTNSWLQFETTTQTLYGILTSNQFSSSGTMYFSYTLIATNSRGYSTLMTVNLKGSRQIISFGALFLLQGRDNSLSSTNDVRILSTLLQKLRKYLKDKRSNTIEVASFRRSVTGQQKIFSLAYSNTTITTGNCDGLNELIPLLQGKDTLVNGDLTVALTPEVVTDRIDITKYGNCAMTTNQTVLPSPTPGGLFPVVQNSVPVIIIKTGVYFRYRIPTTSFYDATDGNTAQLTLQVVELNGNDLGRDSWIQFDTLSKSLYGILPSNQQTVRPLQNFTFLLRARNSLGNTASQVITIQSEFAKLDIGVVVTFVGRDYSSNQWNRVQLQNFILTQLRDYFDVTSNDTIQILSFRQQTIGGSQFSTLWTDSRLTSTGCDLSLLRTLESKVFSSKDTIHPDLISTLVPSVVLVAANITYYGQCSRNRSTTAPIYITALPFINIDTGSIFTYTIPKNTFMDDIDGDARSLLLTLSNTDGSAINSMSRVQFNSSRQTITGIYVDDDLQGASSKTFHYILTASNTRDIKTRVSLSILALLSSNIHGIIVNTSTNTLYSQQSDTVQLATDFLRSLSDYIQPSVVTDFSIISLKRTPENVQKATIIWSYVKISGINCNRTRVDQFKALLNDIDGKLNPQFTNAMFPRFGLLASSTQTIKSCNDAFSSTITATDLVSISPTKSTPLISSTVSSVINSKNHPPSVTSKILPLFAYFCIPFSYTIPSDLFYDQEQGGTRNLKVHLESHDRQPVGTTSWLQFSRPSQVLYGILKIDDFYRKPSGGYKYYLVATDNQGSQATTDFTITIPESPVQYNHVINMTLNRVFDNSVPDVNEQLLISTRILESFGDENSNNINLISYKNSPLDRKAVFTYSNCSLAYSPCPTTELAEMLSKIADSNGKVTTSFRSSMLAQYTIFSIEIEKLAPCNFSLQSSIPTSSVLLLPTPSVPPSSRPILQAPIGQLNLTWCEPLFYQIPADMFHDANDGSTRMLSVEVLHPNGTPLGRNYWVKFDKYTQTLSAYPTVNDIEQYAMKEFLVSARNSRNLTASQIISVASNIPKPNPNHQLVVTASAYVTEDFSDVDIRILIYNKMKLYFKSNQSEIISFANYTKTGKSPAYLKFTFSYCSVKESACDRSELDSMLKRIFSAPGIINPDFIVAFSPEIVVQDIAVKSLGVCSSAVPTPSWTHSSASEVLSPSVTGNVNNQKPLVLQSIGIVDVDPCKLFTFTIPERSFYDIEDGFTPSLKITIKSVNGLSLLNVSWIMFDSTMQSFKGVITASDEEELRFVLTATDKGGLSASQTLEFRVQSNLRPFAFIVNTTATNHFPTGKPRVEILEYFMNRLVLYLSASKEISIQILSFEQSIGGVVKISWATCNLADACNATFLSNVREKLFIKDSMINPNLAIALGPNLIVTRLQIQSNPQCSSLATSASTLLSYTIASVSSMFASTATIYSSTIMSNSPPRFNNKIPVLNASMCSPFSLKLPSSLCVDPEDGVSGVKISVAYKNGSSLSTASLLQFNNVNKTIYGIIKDSDLSPNGQLKSKFLVYCEDSQGLRISRDLIINVTTGNNERNKNFSLTFQTYFFPLSNLPDIDIQLLWTRKFNRYLQDPSENNLMFLNFRRDLLAQAEFSVRFCLLDTCNQTALLMAREKIFSSIPILNPRFIDAMVPEFNLVSASIQAPLEIFCPTASTHQSSSTQSSSVHPIYNTPVKVLRDIPVINITICNPFEYAIATDTFYDKEDGYTANLTVGLFHENNSAVDSSLWVQYDSSKLSIQGYIPYDVAVTSNLFKYKLIARDSRGSTAGVLVTLMLSSTKYNTINHHYETEADLYANFENNFAIMKEVSNKIKTYFEGTLNRGIFFVNFVKYNYQRPKILFTWGSCALLESCDQTSLKAVSDRLLLSGTILNLQFIAALAPNILVTMVAQSSITNCTGAPTTVATSPFVKGLSTMPSLVSTIIVPPTAHLPEFSSEAISPTPAYVLTPSSTTVAYPVVKNPLNPIITAICSVLFFQIAENTFYDPNDGYTRNLKVATRLHNEDSIPDSSWVRFDSESQTFIGQPTIEAVKQQPKGGYLFKIHATNKLNLSVETSLTIKIDENYPNVNHNITLQFEELGTPFDNTLDVISFMKNRTEIYFGDTFANNIGMIGYSRSISVSKVTNVTWYNCSIANSTCDVFSIKSYLSKIVGKDGNVNGDFSTMFLPRLRLIRATTGISYSCIGTTSTLSTPLDIDITNTRLTVPPSIQFIASSFASTVKQSTSKYSLSSVIEINNNPPVAFKSLNVTLPFCGSLRFAIPNAVFYDKEDGGANNLDLELSSVTGHPIGCNSTVRLNQTTKEIYGGVVLSVVKTPLSLLLTAKDKGGLTATSLVSFSTAEQPLFTTFVVTFKIKELRSKCTADNIEDFHSALKLHLPHTNFTLLNYRVHRNDSMHTVTWTDCSLIDEKCDRNKTSTITESIIQNNTIDRRLFSLMLRIGEVQSVSIVSTEMCDSEPQLYINITYCDKTKYVLNDSHFNSTVFDMQRQRIEKLSYQLTSTNGDVLPWVRFDSKTSSIIVMPVYNALKNRSITYFILNATYAKKVIKVTGVTLLHSQFTAIQLNYTISMKIISYKKVTLSDIELMENIVERLSSIISGWLIVDYNRTGVFPETVHITLAPCSTISQCNDTLTDLLTSELSLGDGVPSYNAVRALLPDLVLSELVVSSKGACGSNVVQKVNSPINITVALCTELYSPVKDNMIASFVNITDAVYELLNSNKGELGSQSWVQFNRSSRVIYGVPTQRDLIDQATNGNLFFLRVWEKSKTHIDILVNISITGNTAKPAYSQMVFYQSVSQRAQTKADILLDFKSKIVRLLGNVPVENIGIISFDRGSDLSKLSQVEYTNCSLLQLPGYCEKYSTNLITQKTMKNNGQPSDEIRATLGVNYRILKIIEARSSACGSSNNSLPKVKVSLPELRISSCARLEFLIPNDTFVDKEDGGVQSLLLSLKTVNGASLQAASWVQFDAFTKTIYGIPTYDVIENKSLNGHSFLLEARDSQNGSVSLPVTINFNENVTDRSLINVIMNTSIPEFSTVLELQRLFLQKMERCLNVSQQSIAIAYYRHLQTARENINISIFHNCSRAINSCDETSVNEFMRLFVSNSTVTQAFKLCMAPEFLIIEAKVSLSRLCKNLTVNNPPLLSKPIPQLNLTSCGALYYRIPNDTFTDVEDGEKILSKVELTRKSGGPIQRNDFVQYDKQTRVIYAVLPHALIRNVSELEYNLQVKDTEGDLASTRIIIKSTQTLHNFAYTVCVSLRKYSSKVQPDIDIITNVLNRIGNFISGVKEEGNLIATNYKIDAAYPQTVEFCFSNCSHANGTCERSTIDAVRKKLFIRDTVPTLEFRQVLSPDFLIMKVTDAYSQQCSVNATPTIGLRTSASLLTSSVTATPTSHCLSGLNSVPIVLNSIGTLTVYIGQPMFYEIKNDVIFDKEDGYLPISALTGMTGNEAQENWIQYNKTNQRIFISVINSKLRGTKSFKILGRDSCGASVYDVMKINIVGSLSCCYTIGLVSRMNYSTLDRNAQLKYSFFKRLTQIYNDTFENLRMYSLHRVNESHTVVSYTNSSFTNESCLYAETRQLASAAFYENGTVRKEFVGKLSDFRVYDVIVNNNSQCNATITFVPPVYVTPPGNTNALTYQDWLWYILPFIILAFLVICCCFLFYWCTACRETFCGAKKADDLFTAAGAQPIQEEIMPQKGAAVQDEDPSIISQAAVAARPNDGPTDPYLDPIYADIGTTKDSSVPSLHKNRQMPLWMRRAAKNSSPRDESVAVAPVPAAEEPMIEAVAAMPQEAPPGGPGAPSNLASQPRRRASEVPLTTSHIQNMQRRPSYLMTPSTSGISFEEDPLTQSVAPIAQAGRPIPERQMVSEDMITPVSKHNLEAEVPLGFDIAPDFSSLPVVDNDPNEASLHPISTTGLRLPSIPLLSPGEPPPSYSSLELHRQIQKRRRSVVANNQPNSRVTVSGAPKTRPIRRRGGQVSALEENEIIPVVEPRRSTSSRFKEHSLRYVMPKEKADRYNFIRRVLSKPRRSRTDPTSSLYTRHEPAIIGKRSISSQRNRSPSVSAQRNRSPSVSLRKSPSLSSYLTDSDKSETSLEENGKLEERRYETKKPSDSSDESSVSQSETQVPVEINGVVNAPESVLMNWMRDGTLKTTITNVSPDLKRRKQSRDSVKYKIRSPKNDRKREKRAHKSTLPSFEYKEKGSKKLSKRKKQRKQSFVYDPNLYLDDTISDDVFSHGKASERTSVRGYPYLRGHFEYEEAATKRRKSAMDTRERSPRKPPAKSSDRDKGQINNKNMSVRTLEKNKSRRSICDILERMSRRRELKREREAFESEEFYAI